MAFNVIQAGFGGWGVNWHETVLMPYKGVKTVAWVDADPKVLKEVKILDGVDPSKCFPSLKEAVISVKAEAAVITAGIDGHVPLCREALKAGLHVLVEKPFAPKISQAKQLVELANEQKRVLMVSQNYRHQPAVRAVEKVMSTGNLGPVYSVSIDFRRNAGIGRKKNEHHCTIDHPLWMDMAIHHYDLLRCLMKKNPVSVLVRNINPKWSTYQDPPAGAFFAEYADGAQVMYRGSWISSSEQTNWSGFWRIECRNGAITWTSRGEVEESVVISVKGKKDKKVQLPKLRYTDRSGALDMFVKSVKNGTEPETSGRDNIGTLAFMDAIVKSANYGRAAVLSAV